MMVRTAVFKEVGGFDTLYKDVYQDCDLNLKIRNAGYSIFQCNDAILTHIDNASRNNQLGTQKQNAMQKDLRSYLQKWSGNKPPTSVTKLPKPYFSIVTPVTNKKQYLDFIDSINEEYKFDYEVIFTKNDDAKYSSSEVLNNLQTVASGEFLIMCHQDILFTKNWMTKVGSYIQTLNEKKMVWGVLGTAGVKGNGTGWSSLINDPSRKDADSLKLENTLFSACTIDEACMITRNKFQYFDEDFDGYHFYGASYCLNSIKHGFKNYVINVPMYHMSTDGTKNLQSDDQWFEYTRLAKMLTSKWKGNYATTTIQVNNNHIYYLLAPKLKRRRMEKIQ
jgi:hypothetical protein